MMRKTLWKHQLTIRVFLSQVTLSSLLILLLLEEMGHALVSVKVSKVLPFVPTQLLLQTTLHSGTNFSFGFRRDSTHYHVNPTCICSKNAAFQASLHLSIMPDDRERMLQVHKNFLKNSLNIALL